ncbi:SDR family oxidoreductase [Candidatus Methylacidithermus pantelleriae]|uniref:Putative NAD(P)-bd_dom domain-containing protein n=1 Tax=Candidatus Methylacidithermus pantelleriae TaxID=2744239 RepID=A0A8J2FMM5_9BACT|nr:NAD(P)H-binding protein [Candidatus Methylacidithermus pantelleriae]CAF0689310.1 putative NAD(P)-bd_dom domain-containing protein [Candidatus Methylacidithermus pantelleriae]
MQTVLVTGGTGFVGRNLVPRLRQAGFEVRIFTRYRDKGQALQSQYGCAFFEGSPYDLSRLAKACEGASAVIHLVGAVTETPQAPFEDVHTRLTRLVVEAACQKGVRRFLHVSALGARPYSLCRYYRSKWQAEQCVQASPLDWTILRPSVIFGKGDRFTTRIAQLVESFSASLLLKTLPLPGGGVSFLQPVAVWDVAEVCLRALGHPDAIGRTLVVAGPQRLSLRAIVEEIFAAVGVPSQTPRSSPLAATLRRWSEALGGVVLAVAGSGLLGVSPSLAFPSILLGLSFLLHATCDPTWLLPPVPWPVSYAAAWLAERCVGPRLLSVSELCVLEEGSWGDPTPTAELLGIHWTPFSEGIRRYLPL